MANDASQKTEKPTPRRLREARERGQVARSPDLGAWAGMLATTILLQIMLTRGARVGRDVLDDMARAAAHPDPGGAARFAATSGWKAVGLVAPLLLGTMVIGLAVGIGQVGFKPTIKKLKPDFGRLNPFKGLRRMFGAASWWEITKAVAKTTVLVLVAWPAMSNAMHAFTGRGNGSLDELARVTGSTSLVLLRNVSVAGLAIAAVDYGMQRRRLMRQLRMSRHELREELKLHEGHPEMRRAMRSRALAISRNRMIRMVGGADVVVVNPSHVAVALKYEAARGAPEVVAKGAGVIAARIRAEAELHHVPIVHEPVLTRALYRACEVGQLIPVELYEAVAHLLAFVFGLRARGRAHGYHELLPIGRP